jgi:hypothetical protein
MSTFVVKSDLISVATTSPVSTSAPGVTVFEMTETGFIVKAVGATGCGSTMRTPISGEYGFFGLNNSRFLTQSFASRF